MARCLFVIILSVIVDFIILSVIIIDVVLLSLIIIDFIFLSVIVDVVICREVVSIIVFRVIVDIRVFGMIVMICRRIIVKRRVDKRPPQEHAIPHGPRGNDQRGSVCGHRDAGRVQQTGLGTGNPVPERLGLIVPYFNRIVRKGEGNAFRNIWEYVDVQDAG